MSDKLDNNNVHEWRFRMTNFMMRKGYWKYIKRDNENVPQLPETNQTAEQLRAYEEWDEEARNIMYSLSISIHDSMIGHIQDAKTPKEAWKSLVTLYKTNKKAKQSKQAVSEFVTKIKDIEEEKIVRQVINGIKADDKWESFTTAMDLYMDMQIPDLTTLMGQLFTHEAKLNKNGDTSKDKRKSKKVEDEGSTSQANYAGRGRSSRGRGRGGRFNHHQGYNNNCNNNYNNNYNGNYQGGSKSSKDYNNYTEEQDDSLLIINMTSKPGTNDDHLFYIDSGCSNHVAGNVALLSDLEEPKGKHQVQTSDDTKHSVVKFGHVKTCDGNKNLLSRVCTLDSTNMEHLWRIQDMDSRGYPKEKNQVEYSLLS
ncbi:hypothetical protein KP509_15G016200 [Ceratopteris richardii]|uniref:Retrovirus-related Pol polyprotein from transposon TNT 1-94-like beta-barrel domain-containing protein n=1 Tax=Ceratopteris richardii TaxID=49495 RepID=A0A8T2T780_CERRI|nr:hypothetical protein KP509_15G016200 [Ceratopteris richardii]